MKVGLNWLKDYVSYGIPLEKLIHRLTMAGLEVEREESVKGEKVIEMEITPNRPDCLNVVGVAREVSAFLNKPLKLPKIPKFKKPAKKAQIVIENKKDCGRYVGVVIQNVSVKGGPAKIKSRIQSVGVRSVNNIVDITNFCLMELGQPLHAFDYDKLSGGKIIVRRAKKGEKIVAIDGNTYALDPSIMVIADTKKPVAIAGIMGGQETEVTANTKNILLESAYFDPILVRRASRKLKLSSDSSYRFERGVDVNTVEVCSRRAMQLIKEAAGGIVHAYTDSYPGKSQTKKKAVTVRYDEINNLLGSDISPAKIRTILKKLGFSILSTKASLKITAPDYRGDIKDGVDIIEEIARIVGYDNLPETIPSVKIANISETPAKKFKDKVRGLATGYGFNELTTFTLTNEDALTRSGCSKAKRLRIQNPLTVDQELMRPSLLPSFLSVAATNVNRGQKNLKFFEIGKIFHSDGSERECLVLMMTGDRIDDWRQNKNKAVNLFDLKGVIENICTFLGAGRVGFEAIDEGGPSYQAGRAAAVKCGSSHIGTAGFLSRAVLDSWSIKTEGVIFAELDLEWLFKRAKEDRSFKRIPEYPAVIRDISVAVKKGVSYGQVVEVVEAQKADILQDIRLVEEYRGEKLPEEHRGLVVSLTYQSATKTLTEDEVHKVHEDITRALTDQLGAIRR